MIFQVDEAHFLEGSDHFVCSALFLRSVACPSEFAEIDNWDVKCRV